MDLTRDGYTLRDDHMVLRDGVPVGKALDFLNGLDQDGVTADDLAVARRICALALEKGTLDLKHAETQRVVKLTEALTERDEAHAGALARRDQQHAAELAALRTQLEPVDEEAVAQQLADKARCDERIRRRVNALLKERDV